MSMNQELLIAVCDDNQNELEAIVNMVTHIFHESEQNFKIVQYDNAAALLKTVEKGNPFHIFLLDVMMDDMTGLELAKAIRKLGDQTAVVFVSSNRELALYGYEVAAERYLAKPLQEEKLREALLHCLKKWQDKKEILIPTGQGQYRTSFSEIQYIEAFERGTRFVLTDEIVETKLKFSDAAMLLPRSSFVICHRAYIVNIAQTKRIHPYEFDMKSGMKVPISRHRYNEVNRQFVTYLTI